MRISSNIRFMHTSFTSTMQSVFTGFVFVPILKSCRKRLLAFNTHSLTWKRNRICSVGFHSCILITYTLFAVTTKTIAMRSVTMPVFSSRRKPAITFRAILFVWYLLDRVGDNKTNAIHWPSVRFFKVECPLSNVLRYNAIHSRTNLSVITPSGIASTAMAPTCFEPQLYQNDSNPSTA